MNGRRGGTSLFVVLALAAIAGIAGITSVAVNSSENRDTYRTLADPDALESELAEISDADLERARNDLPTNAQILSGFASLGTATLPSGENAGEVAGRALAEQANSFTTPAVTDAMSDPSSAWNQDRPEEGTTPTGGVIGGPDAGCVTASFAFINETGRPLATTLYFVDSPYDTKDVVRRTNARVLRSTMYNSTGRWIEQRLQVWAMSREPFSSSDPARPLLDSSDGQLCWGPITLTLTCEGFDWVLTEGTTSSINPTHAVCPPEEGFLEYRDY